MEIGWKDLARIKTKFTGVYYRTSITNGKEDKTYYITFYDNNKKKEVKIGKYSEGVREAYCNQKRNETITKLRLGEEPPVATKYKKKKKVLLSSIADEYFRIRRDGKSKQSDLATFNKHLKDYFVDMESVTKSDIEKLKIDLKEKVNTKGIPLSDQTIKNIFGILSAIVNFGLKEELIKNDITKYYKRATIDNARERYLNTKEIQQLYETLESKHPYFYFVFAKLLLNTGARAATIMNIKKKDINFTQNTIILKDFKNDTTYTGFINNDLKLLLKEYTEQLNLNDFLLTLGQTTLLRNLGKILNELFNDGLDSSDRKNRVVVHTLRHTFASHLAINGTPIFTIQKLMNHKDIKMTMRYAKLAPDSGRESVINLKF